MTSSQSSTADDIPSEGSSTAGIPVANVFDAVADHYKQDLREFFARSNFYLAVQAALLSVFGVRDVPADLFDYVVTSVIVLAGLVLACVWGIVSHGSVLWIKRWRAEVQRLSRDYSATESYDKIEQIAADHPYQSPEELTKLLPWFFAVIWLVFAGAALAKW